ncbi:MAG TPA: hypothetical protein VF771_13175 [Longimicrobiaceae bacterium]
MLLLPPLFDPPPRDEDEEEPPLFEPPPLREPDDEPPLRDELDPLLPPLRDDEPLDPLEPPRDELPPLFEPPELPRDDEDDDELFDPLLRDEEDPLLPPPLFDEELRDDEPPLLPPPLFDDELRDEEPPLLFDDELRDDDEPPLLPPPLFDDELRDEDEREEPPLERDEPLEREALLPAAFAAAAPSAAPAAAPAAVATLRREVLRFSFSPRPALKPTVVRSGILISVPVRGLRPVRAARVRLVNFPKPGMDSDPAACTASEMAPVAVSKMASTTRAAAALVSSALSATASMNSDLFMFGSPSGAEVRRGPSAPNTHDATSVPLPLGSTLNRLASPARYPWLNPVRKPSITLRAASAACPKVSLALSL